jgi:hypothetical protein
MVSFKHLQVQEKSYLAFIIILGGIHFLKIIKNYLAYLAFIIKNKYKKNLIWLSLNYFSFILGGIHFLKL